MRRRKKAPTVSRNLQSVRKDPVPIKAKPKVKREAVPQGEIPQKARYTTLVEPNQK